MTPATETDVLVVGGGPVGLAAAIASRLAGFRVALADKRTPPIDKACGEGILPDGAEILERLGVRFSPDEIAGFAGIRFLEGGIRATARFPGGHGLGLRRTVLHRALVHRAEQVGVRFLWGRRVLEFHPDDHAVRMDGARMTTRWVIGADGLNSSVRRAAGLDVPAAFRRFGIRRHYRMSPWSDCVEVYWSDRGEAYVTPVGGGAVCVAILHRNAGNGFDDALGAFPELAGRIGSAPPGFDDRRAGTVVRRLPRVVRGAVTLVGDAAGSVDAITGEGITVGLHQAALLARCLQAGGLEAYPAAFRRLMRLPNGMSSFMLGISRRPHLRRATLRILERAPWIFNRLLRLHTRALPSSHPGGRPAAAVLARMPEVLFGSLNPAHRSTPAAGRHTPSGG